MSSTGIHTTATPFSIRCLLCISLTGLACQAVPVGSVSKLTENPEEVGRDLLLDLREGDVPVELLLQARDAELLYAAGGDAVEPGEVRLHVQGEAVRGDPAGGELDADGGHLLVVHPNAGVLWVVPPFEPVLGEGPDQDVFEVPQVPVRVAVLEPQDGVADDLTRPVEGRVPAPVAPEDLGPERAQVLLPRPEVGAVSGGATHSVDRRVLAQDEGVGNLVPLPLAGQVLLQIPRPRVR